MAYGKGINNIRPVPGTTVKINDYSQIPVKGSVTKNGPVILCAAACDKGTEALTMYDDLQKFRDAHLDGGVVNFDKYGLPLYLADEMLSNKCKVYFKRIVSDSAKLANLGVVAVVNKVEEQKVNENGDPLYKDPDGNETTESTTQVPDTTNGVIRIDKNIKGTTNEALHAEVVLTIENDEFKDITQDTNLADWVKVKDEETLMSDINNGSLTFTVKNDPTPNNNKFTIQLDGTPTEDIEKDLVLTIPSANIKSSRSISVEIKISINESGGTNHPVTHVSVYSKTKKNNNRIEARSSSIQNEPIMISKASIQFGAKYIEDCKTIENVIFGFDKVYRGPEKIDYENEIMRNQALDIKDGKNVLDSLPDAGLATDDSKIEFPDLIIDENSYILPLFIITDKGRGLSNKRIRIYPDFINSKFSTHVSYILEVLENGKILSSTSFAFDPDYTENYTNRNIEVQHQNNPFIDVKVLDEYYEEFFKIIEEFSGVKKEAINSGIAITQGVDKLGKKLNNIIVSGVNLAHTFGIKLSGGDYGKFGNNNANVNKSEECISLMESFYKGDLDPQVWNLDNVFFNLVLDANYDQRIKRAIEYLCEERKDVSCLLDMGINIKNLNDFVAERKRYNNHFTNNVYYQYFQINNKFNKKKITSTLPILIGKRLAELFITGRSKPMAGKSFGFSFPEIIEGTICHIPIVTPKVDEKDILVTNQINYGSMLNNVFVLETNYTTQLEHTQLSFSNNVLAIQGLIQDIRKASPDIRYRSLSTDELELQKEKYNNICAQHKQSFKECSFDYDGTEESELNKTFEGKIIVVCNDFTMKESFNVFVVHASDSNKFRVKSI